MEENAQEHTCFTEENMHCLADKLDDYANSLSEHEKQTLFTILLRAMEPLDRFRYLETSDFLSSDEEALLWHLERESKKE